MSDISAILKRRAKRLDAVLDKLDDIDKRLDNIMARVLALADKKESARVNVPVVVKKAREKMPPRIWCGDTLLNSFDIAEAARDIYEVSNIEPVNGQQWGFAFDHDESLAVINSYYDGRKNPLSAMVKRYMTKHSHKPGDDFYHITAIDRAIRSKANVTAGDISAICGDFYAPLILPEKYCFDLAESMTAEDWEEIEEREHFFSGGNGADDDDDDAVEDFDLAAGSYGGDDEGIDF